MEKQIDGVFISYRRKNSRHAALLVYKDLQAHGYDVFIDYESIDSGVFGQIILNQIASRRHFVLILAPGCLDRTVNPEDWLRKEIEYAMEMQRNIVPLLFDGFEFGSAKPYLTGKLSGLSDRNALTVPDGYFDEAMAKVRNRFLKQPAKGVITPAPKSDALIVQEVIQKANKAAEQEISQTESNKPRKKPNHGNEPITKSPKPKEPFDVDDTQIKIIDEVRYAKARNNLIKVGRFLEKNFLGDGSYTFDQFQREFYDDIGTLVIHEDSLEFRGSRYPRLLINHIETVGYTELEKGVENSSIFGDDVKRDGVNIWLKVKYREGNQNLIAYFRPSRRLPVRGDTRRGSYISIFTLEAWLQKLIRK